MKKIGEDERGKDDNKEEEEEKERWGHWKRRERGGGVRVEEVLVAKRERTGLCSGPTGQCPRGCGR